MKILFVYREYLNDNLFVHTLIRELRDKHFFVDCSVDKFWDETEQYDVVNIQWPEEIFKYNIENVDIIKVRERLEELKKQKTAIFYTRHNSYPHYYNKNVVNLYRLIEENVDGIIHMGKYSIDEIEKLEEEINAVNFLIPHHIYEKTYNENIVKKEAREKLNLPESKFIITAFGRFRDQSELIMLLKAFLFFRRKNKYLLAPRMLNFSRNKSCIKKILYWFISNLLLLFNIKAGSYDEIIDNSLLPYYLISSDVIFIQRKHILNSGNVPLAFLFKKVVIGPDSGNLTEILMETNNPIFSPNDNYSIVKALEQSYELVKQNHGINNYNYAIKNMSIDCTAKKYIDTYLVILDKINKNN